MEIIRKNNSISAFVKEIFLLQDTVDIEHKLPFFADGYPGIMFSETQKKIQLLPRNKPLPTFFLFGQTIQPIELLVDGPYKLIVFQLYPFATRLLLGIDPKSINDECFDLTQIKHINVHQTISLLIKSETDEQIKIIEKYILQLIRSSSKDADNVVKMAVSSIIDSRGTVTIKKLRRQLFVKERTLERKFLSEIGVTPKQFAKIIQFSFSLNQIKKSDYTNLTNVAYDNGFADQSHFIKTFKQYTGKSPKELLINIT
ncbi:MAG: helix-turn-helix transcriptional regulator [Bacteroidota bacterium]